MFPHDDDTLDPNRAAAAPPRRGGPRRAYSGRRRPHYRRGRVERHTRVWGPECPL